ncbi:uncharacterized protein LACBIDRAFT_311507 [Laccaria bicolor S238N-H82]|uniref:Predicted protein n=1 Tax=Laccaria bicolor (strain S238N-H82 / ATCC MYA-4686) TaxID=486041 RepID=B0CXJ6_LACBS|nr:uncharacterized protein LACBIDRAFT_311507 [Laccaria bicolor S238N-H82]EDR12735.1 predicted protein [Laccaria bicolor S238N-H82]|eukprot:XP_001876999.1 predicted protein [Laccaria bicolor S238N-H82]
MYNSAQAVPDANGNYSNDQKGEPWTSHRCGLVWGRSPYKPDMTGPNWSSF